MAGTPVATLQCIATGVAEPMRNYGSKAAMPRITAST
jgi:hypothetical protein